MSEINYNYRDLIKFVMGNGDELPTFKRIMVETIDFNTTPLVSIVNTDWKFALREMEWFLSGSCNVRDAHDSVRFVWEPFADKIGVVRSNYATQFRHYTGWFGVVDQIQILINRILDYPQSDQNLITTWNTADMFHRSTPITNYHGTIIQTFVDSHDYLFLYTYQSSVDVIGKLPENWIQYWGFLLWLCKQTKKKMGSLIWCGGDVHIYDSQRDVANQIVNTLTDNIRTPRLLYDPSSDRFRADDFSLSGTYQPILEDRTVTTV